MHVLWLSHTGRIGGAELALVEGVAALNALNCESHVVVPEDGPLRERLNHAASLHVLHSNRWAGRKRTSMPAAVRQLGYNFWTAAPAIGDLGRRLRADVIISNTLTLPVGSFAARRAGLPHVWYLHEHGFEDGLRFHWGRRLTLGAVARWSHRVLVNSETLRKHYSRWLPVDRLLVAKYTVEVPVLKRAASPVDHVLRVVLVGHKNPNKGQMDAVTAVGMLVAKGLDVRLQLVGGGDPAYEHKLREAVARLRLEDRVEFIGFVAEPWEYVGQADVALMCSRFEGLGRVTIEAMKLGKPVVATASGANPEIVKPGVTGLLYAPGRPEELAHHLKVLNADRLFAQALGENGRKWALENFNASSYGTALLAAVEGAVAAARQSGVRPVGAAR